MRLVRISKSQKKSESDRPQRPVQLTEIIRLIPDKTPLVLYLFLGKGNGIQPPPNQNKASWSYFAEARLLGSTHSSGKETQSSVSKGDAVICWNEELGWAMNVGSLKELLPHRRISIRVYAFNQDTSEQILLGTNKIQVSKAKISNTSGNVNYVLLRTRPLERGYSASLHQKPKLRLGLFVEFSSSNVIRGIDSSEVLNSKSMKRDDEHNDKVHRDLGPSEKYYGVQTLQSVQNFPIGDCISERMPLPIIKAFGILKKATASANKEIGLDPKLADAICQAADEVISGKLYDDRFSIVIWQPGSENQTNMNTNEVIANRACEILGSEVSSKSPLHIFGNVNKLQISYDIYSTAMLIAVAMEIHNTLIPGLKKLHDALDGKVRHHAQHTTLLTLGQELSEYACQLQFGLERIEATLPRLYMLPAGEKVGLVEEVVDKVSEITSLPFVIALSTLGALAPHDALVEVSSALNVIACSIMKIANAVWLLASECHCGLGKLLINEPKGRFMAEKVKPSQCEVISMVAAQVMGNHVAVTVGDSNGNYGLHVSNSMIVANVLRSIRLLGDSCVALTDNCIDGITVNKDCVDQRLRESRDACNCSKSSYSV